MSFVTTSLMGGLGNYLFQISTSYAYSIKHNKKFFCDVNDIFSPHKPYTFYLENILRKINFSNTYSDYTHYNETNFNYSEIPTFESNVKLTGHFQSEKYFYEYKDNILNLFSIDDLSEKNILEKYSQILNLNTCSLHVRRGDYINLQSYHPLINLEYYKKSVEIIGEDKIYLIFSDDLSWCENNLNFIKNKIIISGNDDYIDLYLMSMCDNNIIANSSFSWWGAWLNKNENKKVISPQEWFGPSNNHLNIIDLIPIEWIKI